MSAKLRLQKISDRTQHSRIVHSSGNTTKACSSRMMNGRVLKSSAYRVNGGREAKTMALEDNVAAKRYREKERCRSSYKREETYYFGRLEATFRVIKRKEHSATDSPRH